MTADDALRELAAATAASVAEVLRMFLPDDVEVGEPEVVPQGTAPLSAIPVPAIAAEVAYSDGTSGGNVFVTTVAGVRRLAAAMMGGEQEAGTHPLDELERSAFAEAMNQLMTAAAEAIGTVLGEDVGTTAPEVRDLETVTEASTVGEGAAHATGVHLTIDGQPCRFILLVPKSFVLRMTRALDDRAATDPVVAGAIAGGAVAADGFTDARPDDVLRSVPLRVCAEIGRATMPLSHAVAQPPGGLIALDRGADDPVDVLVNGRRFATGRLVLVDDEWAVRIEQVLLDPADLPPGTPATIERG